MECLGNQRNASSRHQVDLCLVFKPTTRDLEIGNDAKEEVESKVVSEGVISSNSHFYFSHYPVLNTFFRKTFRPREYSFRMKMQSHQVTTNVSGVGPSAALPPLFSEQFI